MVHRPLPSAVVEPAERLPDGDPVQLDEWVQPTDRGDGKRFQALIAEVCAEYELAKYGYVGGEHGVYKTMSEDMATRPTDIPKGYDMAGPGMPNDLPLALSSYPVQGVPTPERDGRECVERWAVLASAIIKMQMSDIYEVRDCWQAKATARHSQATSLDNPSTLRSSLSGIDGGPGPDVVLGLWTKRSNHWIKGSSGVLGDARFPLARHDWVLPASLIVHPDSLHHLFWALAGLLFVTIDMFFLSMSVYGLERPWTVVYSDCTYWTCDLAFNFCLGYHFQDKVVMNMKAIAKRYLRTWFLFDCSLMTASWVLAIFQEGAPGTGAFRYFRLVRLTRLIHVHKFANSIHDLLFRVQTEWGSLVIKTVGYMFCVALWIHANACFYYWIGNHKGGWTDQLPEGASLELRYFISVHWVASQFQGGIDIYPAFTTKERAYVVINLLGSMAVLAMVVSKITNLLGAIQDAKRERNLAFNTARRFADSNGVRAEVLMEVYRYLEKRKKYQMREHAATAEQDLFMRLPFQLRRKLLEEARWPHLKNRIIFLSFHHCSKQFQTQLLCDVLQNAVHLPDHLVFQYGAMCPRLYVLVHGDGHYTRYARTFAALLTGESLISSGLGTAVPGGKDIEASEAITSKASSNSSHGAFQAFEDRHRQLQGEAVHKGCILSEMALWTPWLHVGDFEAVGELSLFTINIAAFVELVASFTSVQKGFRMHAQRVVSFLTCTDDSSDLLCSEKILPASRPMGTRRHSLRKVGL